MISGFIAKKTTMSSIFTPEGKRIGVTTLKVVPLTVTQLKSVEKDGYEAVQIAYGTKKRQDQATSKKMAGLKLDLTPKAFKEFKLTGDAPSVGDKISIDAIFAAGDDVSVTGVSKGHGFAGVIKRYGFRRQPVSGGQSDRVRAPGAIGAQTPGKVIKGKKMPGHYGNKIKTISGLKVVSVDVEKQEIVINGPIPGPVNSFVTIYKA